MHPTLAAFPSARFYEGRLIDGVTSAQRPAPRGLPWPSHSNVMFIEVEGKEVRHGGVWLRKPLRIAPHHPSCLGLILSSPAKPSDQGLAPRVNSEPPVNLF